NKFNMLLHIGAFDSPGGVFIGRFRVWIFPSDFIFMVIEGTCCIGITCGAYNILLFTAVGTIYLACRTIGSPSVFINVGYAKMIIFVAGCMVDTASITKSFGGIAAHVPVHYIQLVDKLFYIMVTRKPGKTLPVTQHIFHVTPFGLSFNPPNCTAISQNVSTYNVSNSSFGNLAVGFNKILLIAPNGAANYTQVFGFGFFGCFHHLACANRINGDGFFLKNMLVSLNGGCHMLGAKV